MNERIFRVLYNLALRSPGVIKRQGQVFKMAAAISCKRGQIVSTGVNQIKSHPIMVDGGYYNDQQIYLHAEADAIRKALRLGHLHFPRDDGHGRSGRSSSLKHCQIHVLRLKQRTSATNTTGTKQWMLGNARPCAGCMNLIHAYGLREIFWTQDCEIGDDWSKMKMFSTSQPQ